MRTLGVIAPYLMGTYPGALVSSLHAHARKAGAALMLLRTGSQNASYSLPLGLARADAWVVVLNAATPELLYQIHRLSRPICVIGHDYGCAEFGLVRTDNQAGMHAAMTHLYAKGHRRFAFIGPVNMEDFRERRDAVLAFARQHPDCAEPLIGVAADFSYAAGRDAAQAALASGRPFSVLMTATDNNALGAMAGLRERGLRVPEDVCVVGYDNSVFAKSSGGGITTLDQSLDQLAEAAFADAWSRLQRPDAIPARQRISPRLILRTSTGDEDLSESPQLVDRQVAQSFIAVSEEVGQLSTGGRAAYLQDYLKRLEFRLKYASIARLIEHDREALILSALPDRVGLGLAVPGARLHLEDFPPEPASLPLEAGDFLAVLMQAGLVQGTELMSMCFRCSDLDSALSLETLVHELELLCYQLHVQLMRDELDRALDSLRAAQGELLRSEKQAALGIAVAGVAHELNTPLGNCLLSVSTLSDITQTTRQKFEAGTMKRGDVESMLATAETASNILQRNVGAALRLVGDFKRLRTEQAGSPAETVTLSVVLGALLAVFRGRAARQGIELVCDLDASCDVPFETHPQLLTQVLSELVENALIHGELQSGGEIRVQAGVDAQRVWIRVIDSGRGIPADASHRIFDPFYTTRMGASSGLGLAMVHNLVSGPLQGEVHAEEGRAQGASFLLYLPLTV